MFVGVVLGPLRPAPVEQLALGFHHPPPPAPATERRPPETIAKAIAEAVAEAVAAVEDGF